MNKNGQLAIASEARPRKCQHKVPCADCPWARKALRGWLGSDTPEQWIQMAHGEALADCHTVSNQQCAGMAIYRANVCKVTRDPRILRLPADRIRVFATPQEFLNHHKR